MNPDNNNPQTPDPNVQKLEDDLQKINSEEASTVLPTPAATDPPVDPSITQPIDTTGSLVPPLPQPQSIETPPPPPNVPVDNGKKGVSVMTIAMIFLIVAIVVAIGYVAYAKFIAPPAATPVPVQTMLPTLEPLPIITPQATDSATPTIVPPASASATPLATP